MIGFLAKSGACMAILLVVYHIFLEREKMHRFNRYFLLFSLIFSLSIPLITINSGITPVSDYPLSTLFKEVQKRNTGIDNDAGKLVPQKVTVQNSSANYYPFLLAGYLVVCLALIIRFLRNLYRIISTIQQNRTITVDRIKLVLVEDCTIPNSFFNYIFVDKVTYLTGKIDKSILDHEQTHACQKHSLDIIFIEVLKILLWFNPVIYFYKKAIQLNHEYLADEAAITNLDSISHYQQLLLKKKENKRSPSLTSSIQYSIIKKRFIMMTKQSNHIRSVCKQLAMIPLLAVLLFAFSIRNADAQDVKQMSILELTDAIHAKMQTVDSLSGKEKQRLRALLSQMQSQLMIEPSPEPPKPLDPESLLNRYAIALQNQSREYANIPLLKENEEKLKATYQEVMSIYNKVVVLQKEVHKENPPPSPPKPLSPTQRLNK